MIDLTDYKKNSALFISHLLKEQYLLYSET